jgi:hypothetical protein
MLVPLKDALMDTPEYENSGASRFAKSIRPVYSIRLSDAGMVSADAVKTDKVMISERIKIRFFMIRNY